MQKTKKVLLENTVFLYILLASKYVFQLISLAYLTRTLEESRYGTLIFATAYMSYFQLLIDFGFILSATKEISLQRENKSKVEEILGSTMMAKLMLALAGLVILLTSIALVPRIREDSLYLILSYIVPVISIALPDYLFRGLEKMKIITVRVVISQAFVTAMLFITVHGPQDYYRYPLLNIAGNLIAVVWTWVYIFQSLDITPKFMGIKYYKDSLKSSFSFFISRMATSLLGSTNSFLLGFKITSAQLGIFGAANNLINAAKGMYSPIADGLYPYMVTKKNFKLIKQIILGLTPLVLLAAVFCYFNAENIIVLVSGAKFVEATPHFRILIISLVLSFYSIILGFPTLGAMGKLKQANYSVVVVAIFHFIALLVMFITDTLTISAVCWLSGLTEALLMLIRGACVFHAQRTAKKTGIPL